jgi:tRNA (guanine37-N1)-methyltransferase
VTFAINIVSIFPSYFDSPLRISLIGRAIEGGLLEVVLVDPKDFLREGERVDDYPYGGGPGMIMRAEPLIEAVESIPDSRRGPVVFMSAAGYRFDQARAQKLAEGNALTVVCGRYEGVDQRAVEATGGVELSVADAVLAGGEAAALVVIEAVARLIEGTIGNRESLAEESFSGGLLEYPQYTRPRVVRELEVPAVLLSGDHQAVAKWRRRQALVRTAQRRPDLLRRAVRSELVRREELEWIAEEGFDLGELGLTRGDATDEDEGGRGSEEGSSGR